MAMFLIAGSFRITGAQPDGDSIRFTPDDPAKWDLITGPNRVKRNASGSAQLRLDAIDALETHYGTPRTHQPLELAHAAAAELLDWLGFSNVVRAQDETVTSSTPDTVAGYILTRSADLYGRCIAFVGRGAPPDADGSQFFVDVDVLRTTANHHLIRQGLAYPTYYRGLFPDLRNEFTAVAKQARRWTRGVGQRRNHCRLRRQRARVGDHQQRAGRQRRTRNRKRRSRCGHRHRRRRRPVVGECDRRLVRQEPGFCSVRESLCDKRFQPAKVVTLDLTA
jgi:hypothetical protein